MDLEAVLFGVGDIGLFDAGDGEGGGDPVEIKRHIPEWCAEGGCRWNAELGNRDPVRRAKQNDPCDF